jgi:hypothetical protein
MRIYTDGQVTITANEVLLMMKLIRTKVAVLAALFALTILQPTSATMKPGVQYPEGTTVSTPGAGATFTIPKGWSGMLPSGTTFFVMGSPAKKSYIFVQVERMTASEAVENMTKPIALGGGMSLIPVGKIRIENKTLIGDYSVEGGKEPLKGYIEARRSDGGLAVRYIAISAPETAAGVRDVVHKLIEETTLDKL